HPLSPVSLRIGLWPLPVITFHAFEVTHVHILRHAATEVDDDLVFEIHPLIRIEVFRLDDPAVADVDNWPACAPGSQGGEKILAEFEALTIDFSMGLGGFKLIAPQGDPLEVGAVITHRLQAPAREVGGDKFRGDVEAARRGIAPL